MERNKRWKPYIKRCFKTFIVLLLVFSLTFQNSEIIFASVHDKGKEVQVYLQQKRIKNSVNQTENSATDVLEVDNGTSKPSIPESEEVRLPEDFYPESSEEIDGNLVEFDDTSATYEQEDGSYLTVFGMNWDFMRQKMEK